MLVEKTKVLDYSNSEKVNLDTIRNVNKKNDIISGSVTAAVHRCHALILSIFAVDYFLLLIC